MFSHLAHLVSHRRRLHLALLRAELGSSAALEVGTLSLALLTLGIVIITLACLFASVDQLELLTLHALLFVAAVVRTEGIHLRLLHILILFVEHGIDR